MNNKKKMIALVMAVFGINMVFCDGMQKRAKELMRSRSGNAQLIGENSRNTRGLIGTNGRK